MSTTNLLTSSSRRKRQTTVSPPEIYDALCGYIEKQYGINRENFVRPFFPGGDYERYEYKESDIVVDNPPFSILSKICDFYMQNGVKFFLFAPHLQIGSCIGPRKGVSAVLCDCKLIYQNGANVSTSFVTNMEEAKIRTAPDLNKLLLSTQKANYQNRKGVKRVYDDHIITASLLSRLCKYYELSFAPESVYFVRTVDDLKKQKSSLYGGGFLISDKAAAEKAAAEKAAAEKAAANYIGLSDREREIIKGLK